MPSEHDRFRKMIESSQDWFWEFDEHANFTYVSPRIRDLLGFEPEELLGLNAFELMSPEEAERVHQHFDPLAEKYLPFNNLINVNIHKDGHEVVIESSGTPIFDEEGRFRGYRGVDRDITARRKIEEEKRKSEESYKLLVENQNELVVKVDADGKFLFVSPTYCKAFGKSEEELLGKNFMPLVHEDDQASTAKAMESLSHPPHTAYLEQRALTQAGWRWLAWSDRAIVDDKGQIEAVVGVGRDITLQKNLADDLRDSKEKLQNIFDTSSEWIWEIDLSGRHTYSNQSLFGFLGYQPEEIIGRPYFDYLHKEDLAEVTRVLPQLTEEKRGWSDWVLRWQHRDGSYRFLESNGMPMINAAGEVVGYRGADRDITERKLMEENYRRLASLTSDYVHYCTRSGNEPFRVQWVDGAFNSISGYSIEEVLKSGCFLPLVHPDDQKPVSDYLLSLMPGDCKSIDFRIVTPQMGIRWVTEKSQCEAGPSEGDLILLGAVTDITERKQAEEALQKNQNLLAQTQQIAQIGSWQLETEPNRLTWSDETYRIFGLEPQSLDVTYETFLEAVHPDDRANVEAAYLASLQEEQTTYEIEHRIVWEKSGEIRHVYEKCKHELDSSGAVLRSIGMVQDITERKTNEAALLAATQAAEAASNAKSVFLAKVSHEIRTPLTAIIGFGELLEGADLTPDYKRYLAAINTSGSTLSSLIDDVLDLSKVDAGELAVKTKEFSLHSLITNLSATQEPQIARKNLSFNLSIDSDVPDLLTGDPLRIRQVLLNLLGNAVKFTEKGDISVSVSVVEESGLRVLLDIAIKDTGVGISTDMQGHVFEPFVQADSGNHNYAGSGLGLTISRSLAGLMGGSIHVESSEGVGSTFHLFIPLQRTPESLSEKPLPVSEPIQWNGAILNILLAEDNLVNSHFIKTVLENMGHSVAVAENGKVALDILNERTFDCVFMDIEMPVMNGDDVLKVIRGWEQFGGKHLTVIALTAYALIGDKDKYMKMGFDGYLSKPVTTRTLVKELTSVLGD